ncbi:MAG: phosphoribosylanthranilate isomerase [Blastocatellia bacterium]|nr:phosphoribosylanthranilate isomerase [Blastocatellia bacterium]MBL8193146.1 phosphoribosylanthranilate isomerase [Blastocatellia bacterium]MBN8723621.1 phosphoribosylanthranilate isomerase [Acidobacteriota bacterium]
MVKVKVCGITSYDDAIAALDLGAEAIGFNFYSKSSRYVAPANAREIVDKLPPFVNLVGVFVNEFNLSAVKSIAEMVKLSTIQLHGNESAEYCSQLTGWRVIKALRVNENFDPGHVKDFRVSAILLDAYSADTYGGTGTLFDWRLALAAKHYCPRIILAGGLKPENVVAAIRTVKPYAVDVCSGVEESPGRKDKVLLHTFMQEVQRGRQEMMKSTTSKLSRAIIDEALR